MEYFGFPAFEHFGYFPSFSIFLRTSAGSLLLNVLNISPAFEYFLGPVRVPSWDKCHLGENGKISFDPIIFHWIQKKHCIDHLFYSQMHTAQNDYIDHFFFLIVRCKKRWQFADHFFDLKNIAMIIFSNSQMQETGGSMQIILLDFRNIALTISSL